MSDSLFRFLRPHKTVPITPWTASSGWDLNLARAFVLGIGLFIFGVGDSLLIQSSIGNAPWSVLAQGVANKTNISMGWSTFTISALVLMLWIPLRQRPGFGTFANIVIIAFAIQVGVTFIPQQENFLLAIAMALLGIFMVGLGSAFYITCGLGPGPRDGLMTALNLRTGVRIGRVRLGIESVVLLLGAALGGTVGVGTLLFAGLIGQSIAINLGVFSRITHR